MPESLSDKRGVSGRGGSTDPLAHDGADGGGSTNPLAHDGADGGGSTNPLARDVADGGWVDRPESRRALVVDRERREYGGIKWGAAFFGWLAATGMAVLVTAVVVAAGVAVGLTTDTTVNEATDSAQGAVDTVGIVGGLALLAILFVSYVGGGYVAGRMARFDGLKQGIGVWVWAIVMSLVAAGLGLAAGSRYNVLDTLDGFPRLPSSGDNLTLGGLVVLGAVLVVSLVGALLGGLAGMRYHRAVDRAGFAE